MILPFILRYPRNKEAPHLKSEIRFSWDTNKPMVISRATFPELNNDPEISRRHFLLVWKNDFIHIEDLKAKNGIYLNGVRIVDGRLFMDDILKFAAFEILLDPDLIPIEVKEILTFKGDKNKRLFGDITLHLFKI